jgi:hypothetical protein
MISARESTMSNTGHAPWVRFAHWVIAASVLTLVFSGFEILMVHPRLYWGKAGNDLTPALIELPISRNYKHGGWAPPLTFFPWQQSHRQCRAHIRHLQPEWLGA